MLVYTIFAASFVSKKWRLEAKDRSNLPINIKHDQEFNTFLETRTHLCLHPLMLYNSRLMLSLNE